MIDDTTRQLLQHTVRSESRSLLHYIGDAFPWAAQAEAPHLRDLLGLIRAEGEAVTALGKYLLRRKITPLSNGAYPSAFTTSNFIALDYLLPRLHEAQSRLIANLEADLGKVTDAEAKLELERFLAVKKRTLAGLERLAQPAGA